MASLAGKVCFVTGGSRGIGKGVATQLARAGATCYVSGRHEVDLEAVAKVNDQCKTGRVIPVVCDHAKDDQVAAVFKRIDTEQGKLDMLVNNAYSGLKFLGDNQAIPFYEQSLNAFDSVCNVGLRSNYVASQLGAKIMVRNKKGLIVNMSSAAGQTFAIAPLYGIGKCAKDRMALDCSYSLKKSNVAFVSYWATAIRTELMEKELERDVSEPSLASSNMQIRYFLENAQSIYSCGDHIVKLLELPHSAVMKDTGKAISAVAFARKHKIRMENGMYPADVIGYRDLAISFGYTKTAKFIPAFLAIPPWAVQLFSRFYGKPFYPSAQEQ